VRESMPGVGELIWVIFVFDIDGFILCNCQSHCSDSSPIKTTDTKNPLWTDVMPGHSWVTDRVMAPIRIKIVPSANHIPPPATRTVVFV